EGYREDTVTGCLKAVGVAAWLDVDVDGDRWAEAADLGHKGVLAAIKGQVRAYGDRKGRLGGEGGAGDIGVARRVHGYANARVKAVAANVAGIEQGGAVGPHLGHKSVVAAVVGQVRSHGHRKGRLGGAGGAGDAGVASGVNGDAIDIVITVAANVASIDQGGAIGPHLGHIALVGGAIVAAAIEGQVRSYDDRKGRLGRAGGA